MFSGTSWCKHTNFFFFRGQKYEIDCVVMFSLHVKLYISTFLSLFSNFLPCLKAGVEENHGNSQRLCHGKNGPNRPSPSGDKERQRPATRAPVPRTYHHDIHGTSGYLPGFSQQSEPRPYRVPSLQRHWGSENNLLANMTQNQNWEFMLDVHREGRVMRMLNCCVVCTVFFKRCICYK